MDHGILIICHNNGKVVNEAMKILDDPRFHFYIIIDKKSSLNEKELIQGIVDSSYTFLKRMDINWGGYSYTDAVVALLNEALLNNRIEYFHMLQGADMPLKTPDEIDQFCVRAQNKSYISFKRDDFKGMTYRLCCKHFFVDNKYYRTSPLIHNIDSLIARLQYPFRKTEEIRFHSALFTIHRNCAEFLANCKVIQTRKYKYSILAEESLYGTLIMNNPALKDSLDYAHDTRLIDWKRCEGASPHTFTIDDVEMIQMAMNDDEHIFARKFSETSDLQIVRWISKVLMEKKHSHVE